MTTPIRAFTEEERATIDRLVQSRTDHLRLVERAQILWLASRGERTAWIARRLRFDPRTVEKWLQRFNDQGLTGLADRPRSGCPAQYGPEQVAEVIATSLTDPQRLGLPFASWTLDRLQAYLNEEKAIPIKRSRIDELLLEEGLRWRTQETWFGERAGVEAADPAPPPAEAAKPPAEGARPLDPDFVEKRGRSSGFTPAPH